MTKTAPPVGEPQRHGQAWLVPSATGHGVYSVYQGWSGRLACDCDDYWYRKRKSGEPCKHILAVLGRMAEGSAA